MRELLLFTAILANWVCHVATATGLAENFDGVTPPALPTGWSTDQGINAGGFPQWQTSRTGVLSPISDGGQNSAFTPDANNVLDNRLYSPTFTYTACSHLRFRQNFDLEENTSTSAYDCGVLEININNTGWADIIQAGGTFVNGGYNHTAIETGFGNPLLPSRPNWSGNSHGFITTNIQLPGAGVGLPVQLRWRMGSDKNVGRLGWRIDSVAISPGTCPPVCPWQIAGAMDFDIFTKPDFLLFNNTTGRTAIWYMNNNVYVSGAYGPTLPAGWSVVAVADFNRDLRPDYALFNRSTGQTAIWYLNNNLFVSAAYGPTVPTGWQLIAVGDFNGDGKPDYVLFNAGTRQTAIWFLDNTNLIGAAYGPTLPVGWHLAAVADFNQDGKADYLLFNPITRQSAIWYLSGGSRIGTAMGPTLPAGWQVAAAADFDGDGKPDYLLYNPISQQTAFWYMNNSERMGGAYAPTLPCD
jgi:hypothetical protein